jgi:hypothetical protein
MSKKSQSTYVQKPVPAEIWAMFVSPLQQMLSVVPMVSIQLSALRRTEVRTLSKIPKSSDVPIAKNPED